MTLNEISIKLKKSKKLIQEEGLFSFLKRIPPIFFDYGTYYIYEKSVDDTKNIPKSKLKNYTFKTIPSLEELNKLEKNEYNLELMNLRRRIKKGALPFCIFSGKNLIHVTWVAKNETAKKEIDRIPFEVNFQKNEVCTGGSLTHPLHRGKGLLGYAYSYILPYLDKNGFSKIRFSINKNNISSQKAHEKFNPKIISKGHYLKILWIGIWKEESQKKTYNLL